MQVTNFTFGFSIFHDHSRDTGPVAAGSYGTDTLRAKFDFTEICRLTVTMEYAADIPSLVQLHFAASVSLYATWMERMNLSVRVAVFVLREVGGPLTVSLQTKVTTERRSLLPSCGQSNTVTTMHAGNLQKGSLLFIHSIFQCNTQQPVALPD